MENHGQKRPAAEQQDILEGVKGVLLDIEGTTTPISFVKVNVPVPCQNLPAARESIDKTVMAVDTRLFLQRIRIHPL